MTPIDLTMTSKSRPRSRRILSPGVILPLAASLPFFWLWYARYLMIEFNELGRHYDAATQTVHTDAAFVWCLPALGFLLIAVVNLVHAARRKASP
ncbi:hypothetical protein [Methyloversatilis discipulorum]|uniref:hypothetical protein n=1 Tax=Methyloversatilis discipulorum TaxID=1119528 RepID=UPI00045E783B|nr:hypothetical protein [Methyloversatilis discipulorum]